MTQPDSPRVAIVNASPLIFLGNADRLELLRALPVERWIVPESVFGEVLRPPITDAAACRVTSCPWLERRPAPDPPPAVAVWDLGAGESGVLTLAIEHGDAWIVLDDLRARRCAESNGLRVIGTVGLVLTAYRAGRLDNPAGVLHELRTAGMWLSQAVLDRALAAIRG